MEKNTVCLHISEYNELRDFRVNVMKGNKILSIDRYGVTNYYTESEAVKNITDQFASLRLSYDTLILDSIKKEDELKKQLTALKLENDSLREKLNKHCKDKESDDIVCEISVSTLMNMSYFQFRKWRKSLKR